MFESSAGPLPLVSVDKDISDIGRPWQFLIPQQYEKRKIFTHFFLTIVTHSNEPTISHTQTHTHARVHGLALVV